MYRVNRISGKSRCILDSSKQCVKCDKGFPLCKGWKLRLDEMTTRAEQMLKHDLEIIRRSK